MAKRTQKNSRETRNLTAPFTFPAISVIIPMYNVEKYIGECLDSLLAQTFKDFEIIVVDDCSTDSSPAIVESYKEKFGGRLSISRMKKNTGSGTEPRNMGISLARGEYIYLMDNDDAITPIALEEMYTFAKKFDADVVHCEKFYIVPNEFWNNDAYIKQIKPYNYLTGEKIFVNEPLIWNNNFEERILFFIQRKLIWNYWVQLIRRKFIIENSIKSVGIMADDMIFTICELCCAKKYVLVPSTIYFYRQREDSLIHKNFDVPKHLNLWISMLRDGFRYLDKFLSAREFFSQRTDLKYLLFDFFASDMLKYLTEIYAKVPATELDELLRKEFADGDNTALNTFIFSVMNIYRLQLIQAQRQIAALENELRNVKR